MPSIAELAKRPIAVYIERFTARCITRESGCIEWQGAKNDKGYGQVVLGKARVYAHRFFWEVENGPIPDGMQVLHKCDNPPCVNTAHHFLGTHLDNSRDKVAKGRAKNRYTGKATCPRGHQWTPENTVKRKDGKTCRACRNARAREYARANPEKRAAIYSAWAKKGRRGVRSRA